MHKLVIHSQHGDAKSQRLAQQLQLPLVDAADHHDGLMLSYLDDKLTLNRPCDREAGSVCVDFSDAKLTFRLAQALSREAVVKAVGGCVPARTDASSVPHVIDATAGLGQDAFILAAAGWQVSLVEQSPIIHALLEDGLRRARDAVSEATHNHLISDPAARRAQMLADILGRLQLCTAGDSVDVLPKLKPASVIYLDPMFPGREKTARVKKNRFLLQQLHGAEGSGEGLLTIALGLAAKVVVKRPRLAVPLDGLKPASSLTGKTSRFDIYVGNSSALK
ncbi:class I SAM-dependent methyltransferase [Pseudohongiella sp.]|uniref:Uncharacterized protein n=1 Tax=marine sediment metagenome TaxID=412755 RepID=A0A0F9W010_9ZZZZ|nr:class I SAM-dependent methyltransferase [Pseudohongiella sp.]HDZ09848.1 SAM-dependent methyltransferase [Pseudohongiella sp.]HEA61538.1 SAM-dependent methyltransferase [Pseudohongiella sp.]